MKVSLWLASFIVQMLWKFQHWWRCSIHAQQTFARFCITQIWMCTPGDLLTLKNWLSIYSLHQSRTANECWEETWMNGVDSFVCVILWNWFLLHGTYCRLFSYCWLPPVMVNLITQLLTKEHTQSKGPRGATAVVASGFAAPIHHGSAHDNLISS